MTGRADNDHYSYTHYADPDTARTFDERRFGGPIGRMIAETQAKLLADSVGRVQGLTILDVGTGTGRAALLFAQGGAIVTGVDASEQMLAIARQRAASEALSVTFCNGDAHALQFPDRSFEVAVSLRVVMHTVRWRECVEELCRVSDQLVILDYPSARSFAGIQSIFRRLLHAVGVRTEPYRVFAPREIPDVLAASGFRSRSVHQMFVLPIAFHKAIGSPHVTVAIETVLERMGLRRLFGSPVTIVAERWTPS